MKIADISYIIHTVSRTNVLPVTTRCNTACIFCSHRQNPPQIEAYALPELSLDDFNEIIGYLSPDSKIIIGDSATRIMEGEPLLHKDFLKIVDMVRKSYPRTPIQITTNGILLGEELVNKLAAVGNIELSISVNSVDPAKRAQLLGLKKPDNIMEKLQLLTGRINFSGSCVYVPEVLDLQDIRELVRQLDKAGAETIKIYKMGYTRFNPEKINPEEESGRLWETICVLRTEYATPILLEPCKLTDLQCVVQGVLRGSAAETAEIRAGDIILETGGQKVKSRVDGFTRMYRMRDPVLLIEEAGMSKKVIIKKAANSSSGMVVSYDIDLSTADRVEALLKRCHAEHALLLTSELAEDIMRALIADNGLSGRCTVQKAQNLYFGGNIQTAGLLLLDDIEIAAREYLKTHPGVDLIIVPPAMFDHTGKDLAGRSLRDLENSLGIAVETI